MIPDPVAGLVDDPDGLEGADNAHERDGRRVPPGTIVFLTPAGFRETTGDDGQTVEVPQYVFVYDGPDPVVVDYIPIHDHRDSYDGGFASAVYHPGTDLPQQSWGV